MNDEREQRGPGPADPGADDGAHAQGAKAASAGVADDAGDEWDRMIDAFRGSAPESAGAPPWLETRVMAEIEALPDEGPVARALKWLVRPAPIRVPPLAGLVLAAILAAVIVLPDGRLDSGSPDDGGAPDPVAPVADGGAAGDGGTQGDAGTGAEAVVYVQFVLEAPGANSVAVAGDFSEWQPSFTLEDVDGDGVWTGRVPVEPGVHTYMFLIDGTRWQTDPRAERYADDGFGNRNAVLAVAAGA